MRNPARAVSKIRRTIKPLFVCYPTVARPTWRLHLPHVRAFVLHTPRHALRRRIMSPFMPRTCAEQLHFKITDFAARFVREHARDKSPYITLRVDDDDANPKFLCCPHSALPSRPFPHWQYKFILQGDNQFVVSTILWEMLDKMFRNWRSNPNCTHFVC